MRIGDLLVRKTPTKAKKTKLKLAIKFSYTFLVGGQEKRTPNIRFATIWAGRCKPQLFFVACKFIPHFLIDNK